MRQATTDVIKSIEALTGSENYASWKRILTSYLTSKQVWEVISGEMERPECQFKYVEPISRDVIPLLPRNLQRDADAIEERLEIEVQNHKRFKRWSKCESE